MPSITIEDYMKSYNKQSTNKKVPIMKSGAKHTDAKGFAETLGITVAHARMLLRSNLVEGAFKAGRVWRIPIKEEDKE